MNGYFFSKSGVQNRHFYKQKSLMHIGVNLCLLIIVSSNEPGDIFCHNMQKVESGKY